MSLLHQVEEADRETLARFDAVIDVRSPGEFAEDHIPGAVNLPVLDDAERAEVGTLYVQSSRFEARRLGAAHVARNIARHLETALSGRPYGFRPLLYCWRGGQRSHAMATVLSQVGWRTGVLTGGYKTYRRMVQQRLYEAEADLKLILLDGHTGTAKTEILRRLAARGLQTLDLEALAEHRGSLFGALPGRAQPSQKLFESRLLDALDGLDLSRPILVEAEGAKVGDRAVPPLLWRTMQGAPRIELTAPPQARAGYLAQAYGDAAGDCDRLRDIFGRLPSRPGRARIAAWLDLARAGQAEALAGELISFHYDPAYARAARRREGPELGVVELKDLDPISQDAGAAAVWALISGA